MASVLVTGARGFLGRHLSRLLGGAGHRVFGIGHGAWTEDQRAEWGVRSWFNGDVDRANIESLIGRDEEIDTVYHLAGGSSVGPSLAAPAEDFRRSVVATLELLEWVRTSRSRPRVVLASSAAVYGNAFDRPINPSDPCDPGSPYGHHKWMAEQLLRNYSRNFGVNGAVLRLFSVYGPELRKQLLWDIATRVSNGPESLLLGGTGEELRDWIHAADAARSLQQSAAAATTGCPVLHGATGHGVTVRNIAQRLCAHLGFDASRIEFSGASRPGDPMRLVASPVGLIVAPEIAWTHGVESYANWFRVHAMRGPA